MSQRFSQELLETNRETWEQAINHRFVTELFEGSVDDEVMAGYLDQDYRFFEAFLQLLGAAITTADRLEARLRYASFAGEMANSEDTYFQRAFEALGVSDELRAATPDTPSAAGFCDLMREAAASQNYSAVVAVLMVTECLYRDWAAKAPQNRPESFIYHEWITLHDNADFLDFATFLEQEADRSGAQDAQTAHDYFRRAVELELAFFNDTYTYPLNGIHA
ncbi:TenA family protein [Nesterenkonia lacusekhoensis]|uniref:Aminopyrimidine aminohydrolase n=2 Tax=Nesterenkonia TaxID=57494 RepID=A0ABU2DS80_9MICC|nr:MULTISPECIES: TenA family protein [Nesterenkonia]MBP2319503.1 thiaminase/transcriptional activator TenA [Nesterenkonia lacusekhoensis]MDR8019230.1 TenA family protein [Nesterenkonia sp. LY-0111]